MGHVRGCIGRINTRDVIDGGHQGSGDAGSPQNDSLAVSRATAGLARKCSLASFLPCTAGSANSGTLIQPAPDAYYISSLYLELRPVGSSQWRRAIQIAAAASAAKAATCIRQIPATRSATP